MSVRALTHKLGGNGRCAACGEPLLYALPENTAARPGDEVCKLKTNHGGERCYLPGEHNSSPQCGQGRIA